MITCLFGLAGCAKEQGTQLLIRIEEDSAHPFERTLGLRVATYRDDTRVARSELFHSDELPQSIAIVPQGGASHDVHIDVQVFEGSMLLYVRALHVTQFLSGRKVPFTIVLRGDCATATCAYTCVPGSQDSPCGTTEEFKPLEPDSGAADAGSDSGSDAGMDPGLDSGMDSGMDAGAADAGDAGFRCSVDGGTDSYCCAEETLCVTWDQVSSRESHTCAISLGGELYCWGSNSSGQVGNGVVSADPVLAPSPVTLAHPPVRVSAGSLHTCVLDSEGAVSCWGHGGYFGDTGGEVDTPELVWESGMVDLSVGGFHVCARTGAGEVYCAGQNLQGQIDSELSAGPAPLGSTQLNALDGGVDLLAAGGSHTCAVVDGETFCWGNDHYGELGDGTPDRMDTPLPPNLVIGGHAFVRISAADASTCAIDGDGALFCWGYNANGRLGLGDTTVHGTPTEVGLGSDWIDVAASYAHTCALVASGDAYCWGDNGEGQLGDTTMMSRLSPRAVAGSDDGAVSFRQLTVGQFHTCGISMDNRLYCWGSNELGQLGLGLSFTRCIRPTEVKLPAD